MSGRIVKKAKQLEEMAVNSKEIDLELDTLRYIATKGSYIGVAFQYSNPMATFISYPLEWIDYYTRNTLSLSDPFLTWGQINEGIIRWSDIRLPDPKNVAITAKEYGLVYGATASIIVNDKRSIATFARSQSEFTDGELNILIKTLEKIHIGCFPELNLTNLELLTLSLHADGTHSKAVASKLNVSNQTIVQRMSKIRAKFGVKTNTEALLIADRLCLLLAGLDLEKKLQERDK